VTPLRGRGAHNPHLQECPRCECLQPGSPEAPGVTCTDCRRRALGVHPPNKSAIRSNTQSSNTRTILLWGSGVTWLFGPYPFAHKAYQRTKRVGQSLAQFFSSSLQTRSRIMQGGGRIMRSALFPHNTAYFRTIAFFRIIPHILAFFRIIFAYFFLRKNQLYFFQLWEFMHTKCEGKIS